MCDNAIFNNFDKSNSPIISIIVPVYNTKEEYLKECFDSILSQTYANYEILIVDDGSEKITADFLDELKKTDDRTLVYHMKNEGVSAARNYGINLAKGSYIVFVDSDDVLLPCFLQEALYVALERGADFVIGANILLSSYKRGYQIKKITNTDVVSLNDTERMDFKANFVGSLLYLKDGSYIGRGPWTRLIKREIAQRVLFNEELVISEDILWNLQVMDQCQNVCYVKKPWYAYRVYSGSSSKKQARDVYSQSLRGLYYVEKELDFTIDAHYKAFSDRCLDEIQRICRCQKVNGKLENYSKLFSSEPWNIIGSGRYFKMASNKQKVKIIFYRLGLLPFADKFLNYLRRYN